MCLEQRGGVASCSSEYSGKTGFTLLWGMVGGGGGDLVTTGSGGGAWHGNRREFDKNTEIVTYLIAVKMP